MLEHRNLVLDTFCEVYDILKPWANANFWNFRDHQLVPNSIYLIGRQQFVENIQQIRDIVENNQAKIILSNPAEGSETLANHCRYYGVEDLVLAHKILLIGGGDMPDQYPYLQYDSFLPKILDYEENQQATSRCEEIFEKTHKPYNFLFLNGRYRLHRQYLLQHLDLKQALWTNLDRANGEIRYLEPKYEFEFYRDRVGLTTPDRFVKNSLFDNTWGEIYLQAEPYIDTYFSLVSETVYHYPYSFRTEKIWKPIAMGHPWIAVANPGYYRDIKNLGFKTFEHVIDESFDNIEDHDARLKKIINVVSDLCQQNLAKFLEECYTVCKYNQQHLAHMRVQVQKQFPERFFQFIRKHQFDE